MHIKYDLKGSTYKRRGSPKEREKAVPTLKDLDFIQDLPDGLLLEADNYNALCKTIQRDCLVSQRAICFSLHQGALTEKMLYFLTNRSIKSAFLYVKSLQVQKTNLQKHNIVLFLSDMWWL